MNKKNSVKKTAALLLGIALTVGGVGCENFIITDSEKDLAQTVATVNIAASLKNNQNEAYSSVADDVKKIVDNLSTDISKRDLVAYFLSTGYQYVENYGYTYEATFNMLMEGLVSREIMIQYAIAYYLKNNTALSVAGCESYIQAQLQAVASEKDGAKKQELLKAHPEVLTLKYFLTDGGQDGEDYDRAVYNLKKSLNDTLDSLESNYIKASSEDHNHDTPRTLPTNVGTEKSDYYATGDYEIYTGRNTLDSCGEYEKVDGSTTSTRQKAYNAFLSNLQGYNMISTSGKIEDTSKVYLLDYYYVELSSLLGQSLISKYFEDIQEKVTEQMDGEYVTAQYNELLKSQQSKHSVSPSAFSTAMDSVSDTSFLLYGLKDFGFVYNILLPFSTSQNNEYTTAKNNAANTQDDLYNIRKGILNRVKGKDLRGSWISEHDHANYAYKGEDGKYYFFEDQISESTKYESLKQYLGKYPYQADSAEVEKYMKGEIEELPEANELTIDGFIATMEEYIRASTNCNVSGSKETAYEATVMNTEYTDAKGEVDYSKFTYYTGKVDLGTVAAKDYFVKGTNIYNAVSAVNELMFAYSTDTGCLNTYYGYAVSPYGTNFVKEFEYAAQEAVKGGVGTYVVCATDYGWHIVFASYVFNADGEVYGGYDHSEATGDNKVEGSFSNLFYESLKASASSNYSTEVQNNVLNQYNNDKSVKLFKDRYQDLLELDE